MMEETVTELGEYNVTLMSTEALDHCHNYTSLVEVYFYANVVTLLFIITLGELFT